jgi:hypothetical protein
MTTFFDLPFKISLTSSATRILQRQCIRGNQKVNGESESYSREKRWLLQRAAIGHTQSSEVPSVHDFINSPGQPLEAEARAFMEPRFGYDFSQVRVHTDAKAAESARMINALAYTVGQDIVFDAGQYSLGINSGQKLVAHELAHVIQQRSEAQPGLVIGKASKECERQADQVAQVITQGGQRTALKQVCQGLHRVAEQVQRQKSKNPLKTEFEPLDTEKAEEEFNQLKAQYKKLGKTEQEAALLATDDMFAKRVEAIGGKRFPGTITLGKLGQKTYLRITSSINLNGEEIKPGFFNAGIDDNSYNCHSFTFFDGKKSKSDKLQILARTIPKEGGDLAGQKFFDATDLVKEGIYFEMRRIPLIFPRWVLDAETRDLLKGLRSRKTGEKVEKGDIAIYSSNGDLPHSGKVTQDDGKGNPTRIKSKWGHFSLFEHAPEAVPAYYGKPSFFHK